MPICKTKKPFVSFVTESNIPPLIGAAKGARDALCDIPEGKRGNHDSKINRAIRRLEAALKLFGVEF